MKAVVQTFKSISGDTKAVWGVILLVVILDAIGMARTGMSLRPWLLPTIILPVAGLLGLAWVYRRRDPRIAVFARIAAALGAFTPAAALLSYLTVAWGRPLVDARLVAFDRSLGLDWPAAYAWVASHHALHTVLAVAYFSLLYQMIALLLVFNARGEAGRCREVLWLFMAACLAFMPFSALWPALGAFGYFHVQENEPYVRIFQSLRDGNLKVFAQDPVEGIIQFPSLHAGLAIIYTYAARGMKVLFPLFLVFNLLLLIATPFIGGHHFADLWGGIILTAAVILAARPMLSR